MGVKLFTLLNRTLKGSELESSVCVCVCVCVCFSKQSVRRKRSICQVAIRQVPVCSLVRGPGCWSLSFTALVGWFIEGRLMYSGQAIGTWTMSPLVFLQKGDPRSRYISTGPKHFRGSSLHLNLSCFRWLKTAKLITSFGLHLLVPWTCCASTWNAGNQPIPWLTVSRFRNMIRWFFLPDFCFQQYTLDVQYVDNNIWSLALSYEKNLPPGLPP